MLQDMLKRSVRHAGRGPVLDAVQNARLIANAERYYGSCITAPANPGTCVDFYEAINV
jgi:hypothetical protein